MVSIASTLSQRALLAAAGCLITLALLYLATLTSDDASRPLSGTYKHRSSRISGDRSKSSLGQNPLLRNVFNSTLGVSPDVTLQALVITNTRDQFQEIFVINMPDRDDHRDALSLAAAVTPNGGMHFEYVDGVAELSPASALPPPTDPEAEPPKYGRWTNAWRAHITTLRTIVEKNISSAIITEGDIDWDLNIKSQMREFAKASSLLSHAFDKDAQYAVNDDTQTRPSTSAYGDLDRWDVLWLGHCGAKMPVLGGVDHSIPFGRVAITADQTVPEPDQIQDMWGGDRTVQHDYPPHTRVAHYVHENVCSLAYAVSQQGAQRLLYEIGVRRLDAGLDLMLSEFCEGGRDRPRGTCFTVQPALFQHHVPAGNRAALSTINKLDGYNEKAYTTNVRWSTRINFSKLVHGETDFVDQYPNKLDRKESPRA